MNSFILLVCLCTAAKANTFLERSLVPPEETLALLDELEKVAGKDHRAATEARVSRLEEILQPRFAALPKAENGGVKPDAVRYLLRRTFLERHAWFIRGLEPQGESWNSSSPAEMLKAHHSDIHSMFEDRLEKHTFDLHHVAVLAATLETLVHTETISHLHSVYALLGLSKHENDGSEEEVASAIEAFMLFHVIGRDPASSTPADFQRFKSRIHKVYPSWEATRLWAREVRAETLSKPGAPAANSFDATVLALETIADRYGRFQDRECRDLKALLLKDEFLLPNGKPSGRVKLDAFYKSALNGNWQFNENSEALRQLGALDESDPEAPSVIVPNYINSPSNCVASSKFYSVCCIDECEAMLGHLERNIAAPEASPERIIELVTDLSSESMPAPQEISTELHSRLQDVAAQNDGKVPLHTRLFAQWMHHVFPRECPFPHMSGTTNPMTRQQMLQTQGASSARTDEATMQWHVEQAATRNATNDDEIPWLTIDEQFIWAPQIQGKRRGAFGWLRGVMSLGVVSSIAIHLVRTMRCIAPTKEDKHFV